MVFTPEDLRVILNALEERHSFNNDRDRAWLLLVIDTGLRREALRLVEVANCDLENKTVKTYDKKTKQWLLLPFGERVRDAIAKHIKTRHRKSKYLFTNREGKPMSGYRMWDCLQDLCNRAGIPRRKLHLMRNAFSQEFLLHGGSPLDLKTLAGWSSMAMVDHYTKQAQQRISINNYHENKMSLADRLWDTS